MESNDSDSDEDRHGYEERRWNWQNINQHLMRAENNAGNVTLNHNSISPWNKEHDGVTTLYRCDATDARCLYIFDSAYKLLQCDQYDIGGAYGDDDTGLWFYLTTSLGPGRNYLMNIFACQRTPGMFSVGISDSNTLITSIYNNEKVKTLSNNLHWQTFNSTQPDEVIYIKTFRFSEEDRVSLLKMVLIIPILIDLNPKSVLVKGVVEKIRTELEFGEDLLKEQKPDFIITSYEGKEFHVHKIALAAHSPRLRDLIRSKDCNTLSLNISNYEIELLLQYLYTGTIKDILKQQLEVMLVMAEEYELDNLTELVKHAMKSSINSDNALAIAVVAEKYNCPDVQEVAFKYVAHHPEVLDSDAFSEINNATVVKKLLKYIHGKASQNQNT